MIAFSDDKLAKDERTTVSSYLKLGWEWRDFPTAKVLWDHVWGKKP